MREFRRLLGFVTLFLAAIGALTGVARAEGPMLVIRNSAMPDAEIRYSEADLLAMTQVTIRTRTEFTDGVVEFVGPLARDVLAKMPVGGATLVHMMAANDYAYNVPLPDLYDYDVILAMYANGERLTVRDKGPLWVMYLLDTHPELREPKYNHRLVWQLITMELRSSARSASRAD